jgi:hypothetical protein
MEVMLIAVLETKQVLVPSGWHEQPTDQTNQPMLMLHLLTVVEDEFAVLWGSCSLVVPQRQCLRT